MLEDMNGPGKVLWKRTWSRAFCMFSSPWARLPSAASRARHVLNFTSAFLQQHHSSKLQRYHWTANITTTREAELAKPADNISDIQSSQELVPSIQGYPFFQTQLSWSIQDFINEWNKHGKANEVEYSRLISGCAEKLKDLESKNKTNLEFWLRVRCNKATIRRRVNDLLPAERNASVHPRSLRHY
jgi:hypothetical protein